MLVRHFISTEGHKCVCVRFQAESADASAPEVEATFKVHMPEDFLAKRDVMTLIPLSVTRVDTRVKYKYEPGEAERVMDEACSYVARLDETEDWG